MLTIRKFAERDWGGLWAILEAEFRAGETHPFSPRITEDEAFSEWIETPSAAYVAEDESGTIVGTYRIKPNQPSLGAHVCNCGYVVARAARRRGVGSAMCEHSQREAIAQGFRAMQYNLVVSTNHAAVSLWKKHGFAVVGTLAGAFKHPEFGYVDAFVMYKELVT